MKRNKNPCKEIESSENGPEINKGSQKKSLGDHVCQEWDILQLQK